MQVATRQPESGRRSEVNTRAGAPDLGSGHLFSPREDKARLTRTAGTYEEPPAGQKSEDRGSGGLTAVCPPLVFEEERTV